ncbi:MAG TPA: aminodeoxychorismate/anthranilate synthase component II [Bacteroidota bacterium]|nr:aminodeoxychorismate/anthranilate synthase component II [Bacteroidota bacterium]
MILIIDNYDSFTYNLVQLFGSFPGEVRVIRNDKATIESIREMQPQGIVISPGPGRPENAGICVDVIRSLGSSIPILGVCLGHQAIGHAYGAQVVHAPELMHGKTSLVYHNSKAVFDGLPNPFEATRYHSLAISESSLPPELEIIASTNSKVIMGVRHKTFPVLGIQFHPESILTREGPAIVANWMKGITV